jgi:hypothetical protein
MSDTYTRTRSPKRQSRYWQEPFEAVFCRPEAPHVAVDVLGRQVEAA